MMSLSANKSVMVGWSRNLPLLIGLLTVAMWPAVAEAAETPLDKYNMDVICEARGQTGLPIPNQTAGKTKILSEMYAKRVRLSGQAIGKTPTQIAKDIVYWRRQLLQEARTPKKSIGKSDQLEVGKLGEDCAALPIFEAIRRMRGGAH